MISINWLKIIKYYNTYTSFKTLEIEVCCKKEQNKNSVIIGKAYFS